MLSLDALTASAAAPSFDEPLDMLYACHDKVRRFCDQLDALPAYITEHGRNQAVINTITGIVRYFDLAGPAHHQDEEDELFPLILARQPDAAPKIEQLLGEHGYLHSRWNAIRMIYGHVYTAKVDALGNLTVLGDARNDPSLTIVGINNTPWPAYEIAPGYMGQTAPSLEVDPARPVHTLVVKGGLAPKVGYNFTEKQALIDHGIAPLAPDAGGEPAIVSAVTTYTKNAHGARDRSYQNVTTRANLTYIIRFLQARITQKFGRHKLADNGTRFGAGQAITTPNIIRAELVAAYSELEALGLVENTEAFKAALIVERDATNPDRVNVLFAPDLVNELKVFGMLVQFRQQYATAA